MYTKPSKKMLIMNILDILMKYTDQDHRLSQKEILDILANEYDMKVDRKAIKRNLLNLIDFGYDIEYSESVRINKKGEEEILYTDWYLQRDFSDAELRMLIDSLVFSKHVPYSQCKELIEKLKGLSNIYFRSKEKYIHALPDMSSDNRQIFYTIDMLSQAIAKGRKVSFHYNEYGTDKKMHPRKDEKGNVREYIMNPYQIVIAGGKYYLICNNDKYENISNYRLDRITNIRQLEERTRPVQQLKGMENGFDLPKHMTEHIYMFTGESAPVVFRAKKYLLTELYDWFGKDMDFLDETDEDVTVRVHVNQTAMRKWALQYAVHAKVLKPEKLVQEIKNDLKIAQKQYESE